jgi:hypothetical protein
MRFLAPIGLLVFAVACGDVPDSTVESQQFFLVHATERIEGLQFLPPLVKKSKPQGAFTDAVPASVRIENDAGTVVASFTAADVVVDAGSEHYGVTWDTDSAAPGDYRIVVANPARDIGSIGIELRAGSVGNKAHNAGRSLPIRFRLDAAALDQDGDGTVDWEDRCSELAFEQDDDGDCDGAFDDRDDDGVTDGEDRCPDLAFEQEGDEDCDGAIDDRDGDGVVNEDDRCPDLAYEQEGDVDCDGEVDDRDGDGVVNEEDRCPDLAFEQDGDADCDGHVDAPASIPATRITAPGEAYGGHGSCVGWPRCGDAATCALWACIANGYSDLVSHGHTAPCTQFTSCNLLWSPDSVEMGWGNGCGVMGVTDIDCAN